VASRALRGDARAGLSRAGHPGDLALVQWAADGDDAGSGGPARTGVLPDNRWLFMSDVCKHCTDAGCLDACPTGALVRTEFETVIVQQDVCNAVACVPACPFGVIDRAPTDGRAAKCTLRYDRMEDGLEPACAKSCPTDSIQFGPYEQLVDIAQRRVATLHERGESGAYLYGAGDEPGQGLAGGLGAFFLLTQPARALRAARTGAVTGAGERGAGHDDGRVGGAAGRRGGAGLRARGRPPELRGAPAPPEALVSGRGKGRDDPTTRDTTPAVGTAGQPASWERAQEGADVALTRPQWGDARWSYLSRATPSTRRRSPPRARCPRPHARPRRSRRSRGR